MKGKILLSLLFLLLFMARAIAAQTDSLRRARIAGILEMAIAADRAFAEKIDMTVSSVSLTQLLKNVAKSSGANVTVTIEGERAITCNFIGVRVVDLVYFLCVEYELDIELIENILLIRPYITPPPDAVFKTDYNQNNHTVSFEFSDIALSEVVKKIGEETGANIIPIQELSTRLISAFGRDMTINDAIQAIVISNSLLCKQTAENTWVIYIPTEGSDNPTFAFDRNELSVDSLGLITANINNGNVHDILVGVIEKLGINHFFTGRLDYRTSLSVKEVELDDFIKMLFTGAPFSWRVENNVYIFGDMEQNGSLREVRVIPMKYRTVLNVKEVIPEAMKKNMEIIDFPELNSLVVHGDRRDVLQIVRFLDQIDKSVTLISIDVIIVDATDTDIMEAGVSFGKGTEAISSSGTLTPGIDVTLGASTINRLINTFNGFGSINLGKVGPNFYMGLKLLEEKGKVVIKSTPRLSTLNGQKAKLKSGEMKYYKEIQSNIIGTQNPIQSESFVWKSVEANFTLDILPHVSLDSCITLQVTIVQSEFTERENPDVESPPGTITRSFKSIIRVKDQEMVLLGGIEKNIVSKTSKGLPFIARLPVLRWLFGKSSKNNSSQKLSVFVKPTII